MKTAFRLAMVLAVAGISIGQAVTVTVNPGTFGVVGGGAGSYSVLGTDTYWGISGVRSVSLTPGNYSVIVSSGQVGNFSVDGGGNVTSSAPGMVGGAGTLGFVNQNVAVTISPSWAAYWNVDWVTGNMVGSSYTMSVPVGTNYTASWGRQGIGDCRFDVSGAGLVTVHDISPNIGVTGGLNQLNYPTLINEVTVTPPSGPTGSWNLDGGTGNLGFAGPYTVYLYGGNYNLNAFGSPQLATYVSNALQVPAHATPGWSQIVTVSGQDFLFKVVPEPASLSLLALSGLGMLIRRRHVA